MSGESAPGGTDLSFERRRYELIERVVELPQAEQEAILAECEPEMARQVRAALAAAEARGDEFLAPPGVTEPAPELPLTIGAYRLTKVLGEGGMGRVFLAEQSEPVRRRVALKVLRFAAAGREARARFEAERHAMGRLDHPNVGKILDAGTTPDGLPYFAMELIDGAPITSYCDDRRLSLEERLRLFVDVCRGADHAHHKLLLHRDLKPSNLLVAEVDGRAVPKIIDFGIAKGLDASLANATLLTGDRFVGTPAYMSPEALGLGGDVDTRSDVFSLGVVLFELLTGSRPWPDDDETPLVALRRRAGDERVRPSTRVTTLDEETLTEIAGHRSVESAELPRRLRGDLDWITLKAIAHRPRERYGSAADLADDVERYLADEPVSARAPTAGYLLRKLVRRHRLAVIAGLAVLIAVVLGIVGTTVGLLRARAEAERANLEAEAARRARDSAVIARQSSDQLAEFMIDLFQGADASEDASTVTARELLDRGAGALGTRLADQPQARGLLLQAIAGIFANWGDLDKADPLLTEALALLDQPGAEPGAELAEVLEEMVYVRWKQARFSESVAVAEDALDVLERLEGKPEPVRVAGILSQGVIAMASLGRSTQAEAWARRSVDLLESDPQPSPGHQSALGVAYIGLGHAAYLRRDWQQGIEHFRRAGEILEAALGPNHRRLGLVRMFIADGEIQLGHLDEAETSLRKSLEHSERLLARDGFKVAGPLSRLGIVLRKQGRLAESEATLRRSLALRRRHLPAAHFLIADDLQQLAWTIWESRSGRADEAAALLEEALGIMRQAPEPVYPESTEVLVQLGHVELARDRPERAEGYYREALELLEGVQEPHPSDLATASLGLGRSLMILHRFQGAREALDQALGHFEAAGDAEGLAETRVEIEMLDLLG